MQDAACQGWNCDRKGLVKLSGLTDEGDESKHFVAISYKRTSRDDGVILNYCPWCGADIRPEHTRTAAQVRLGRLMDVELLKNMQALGMKPDAVMKVARLMKADGEWADGEPAAPKVDVWACACGQINEQEVIPGGASQCYVCDRFKDGVY